MATSVLSHAVTLHQCNDTSTMPRTSENTHVWWPTSVNLRPNTRHIPHRHTDTTPHYFPRGDTALHFEVCKCGVAGPRAKVDTCGPPYRGLSHTVALHQCNDTSVMPEASENAHVHRSLDCIVLHVTTVMLAPRVGDSALTSRDRPNVTPLHNVGRPAPPSLSRTC